MTFHPVAMTVVYVATVAGFGWATAVYWMRLREAVAVAAMTFTFGTCAYLLTANGLGHAMSIGTAFFVALSLLLLAALALVAWGLRSAPALPALQWPGRAITVTFGLIIVLAGIMNARFHGSDPWSWQHFPLASTIVNGNFPVVSPIDPLRVLAYHYAPAFLAAAFTVLTGWPLAAGFALQPLIGVAGVLLFAGALAYRITGSRRAMVFCALAALAGGGLEWTKVVWLLKDLFDHYILHVPMNAPFRGLAPLFSGGVTTSLFSFMGHRSLATGYPLLYGLLFCLAGVFDERDATLRRRWMAVSFVFALGLTLTMELGFVTAFAALGAYAFLLLCHRDLAAMRWTRPALVLCAVFVPALLVSLVHGGVLSGLHAGESSFRFFFDGGLWWQTDARTFIWKWFFIRSFGLPLLLLPFSMWYAWKHRGDHPVLGLIVVLGLAHFTIPFFVEYLNIRGEMHRVFFGATTLFSFLLALMLAAPSPGRVRRIATPWIMAALLASSSLYFVVRITIPTMRFEASPLFLPMPPITETQSRLYAWVRGHTTMADFFYLRNLTVDFTTVDTETQQMRDRVLFTTYTGRYTIGPIIYWNYDKKWLETVLAAERTCDPAAMASLHVRYLLVEDAGRADWFTVHCKPSDWHAVYTDPVTNTLPVVYEAALTPPAAR